MITTDYIGLRGYISQAWMLAPLVIFMVLIVKLILLRIFIKTLLVTAEKAIIVECHSLENLYQMAASAPQEAVNLANQLITTTVNGAIKEIKRSFILSITAIESLVLFAFDITLGTYTCLTVSAVNIAANEAINATESTIKYADKAVNSIGTDINKGLSSLSKFINSAVGLISSVENYFDESTGDIKNISLTVNKLNNLTIPTSINTKLESLRKDIPTYNDTKSLIENEVSYPFTLIKNHLNSSNFTVNLDFPFTNTVTNELSSDLPQCHEANIKNIFSDIERNLSKLTTALCAVLIISIVIGILFNVWRTKSKWESMVHAISISLPFTDSDKHLDPIKTNLSRISYVNASFLERKIIDLNWLSSKQIWWLRYVTMRPLVDYLVIGLLGILMSVLELSIISVAGSALTVLHKLENDVTKDLSKEVQRSFNTWRNNTNMRITVIETDINTQMLGWINQGSQNVNSTLTHFSNSLNKDLAVFNGTILYKPLQDALMCIIGEKIAKVEKGLTWIHKNSQVTLPKVSGNITLSGNSTSSISQNVGEIAKLIVKDTLVTLKRAIHIQLIVSGFLLGIWVLYAFIAYINLLYGQRLAKLFKFSEQCSPRTEQYFNKEKFGYPMESSITPFTWWKFGSDLPYIVRNTQTSHTPFSELRTGLTSQSPIQKIHKRVTRFFSGPQRDVRIDKSKDPIRGSIHPADDPTTPLKAMIF